MGEYGGPPGGNVIEYNPNDLSSTGGATYGAQWQICRQLTIDCNNNNIGWNLWTGLLYPISIHNRLAPYFVMMSTIPSSSSPSMIPILPIVLVVAIIAAGYVLIRRRKTTFK
jgi:hypothetical protein